MKPLIFFGLLAGFIGCACIYLASDNQQWKDAPWRAGPARTLGALMLAASGVVFMWELQVITALFVLATWVMLLLALFPYVGVLLKSWRNR